MAQITELKHEDRTRRRNTSALAAVGAVALVAGVGWFAASQLGTGSETVPAGPAPSPSVSTSLDSGLTVGSRLEPQLRAKAPDSWEVFADERYVWMDSDGEPLGPSIQVGGPVLKVWDHERNAAVGIPADGYGQWLREHPYLTVLEDRSVVVEGRVFLQLTLMVDDDAPTAPGFDGVLLGKFDGIDKGQPWDEVAPGETFTETVIEVWGQTMVVKSVGATNDAEQAEQDAAQELVLSTMKLPS